LIALFVDSKDGGDTFLRNLGISWSKTQKHSFIIVTALRTSNGTIQSVEEYYLLGYNAL
jgi:hypothetical protein